MKYFEKNITILMSDRGLYLLFRIILFKHTPYNQSNVNLVLFKKSFFKIQKRPFSEFQIVNLLTFLDLWGLLIIILYKAKKQVMFLTNNILSINNATF
jgi:hypothetical protein